MKLPPKSWFAAIAKENKIPLNEINSLRDTPKSCNTLKDVKRVLAASHCRTKVRTEIYNGVMEYTNNSPAPKYKSTTCNVANPDHACITATYWLAYAENCLKEAVIPSLFSSAPWDGCRMHASMWEFDARPNHSCV